MIFWGVIVCGVGHVLIVAGGAKQLIGDGSAKIPFFLGVYILAVGAGMSYPPPCLRFWCRAFVLTGSGAPKSHV